MLNSTTSNLSMIRSLVAGVKDVVVTVAREATIIVLLKF